MPALAIQNEVVLWHSLPYIILKTKNAFPKCSRDSNSRLEHCANIRPEWKGQGDLF